MHSSAKSEKRTYLLDGFLAVLAAISSSVVSSLTIIVTANSYPPEGGNMVSILSSRFKSAFLAIASGFQLFNSFLKLRGF
jgi:hypothetical protein